MKPTNIKFQTELYAHKIEVHVTEISATEAMDFLNSDVFDANALSGLIDDLSGGEICGSLEAYTNIFLPEYSSETLVQIKGTWRIVPNYRDIHRIRMWHYNHAYNMHEYYTDKDFIECFGYNGRHYFEKYTVTYSHNIWEFFGYLGDNIQEGEAFLSLTLNKVEEYETRMAGIGYPIKY